MPRGTPLDIIEGLLNGALQKTLRNPTGQDRVSIEESHLRDMTRKKVQEFREKGFPEETIAMGIKWARERLRGYAKRFGADPDEAWKIFVREYPIVLEDAEDYMRNLMR